MDKGYELSVLVGSLADRIAGNAKVMGDMARKDGLDDMVLDLLIDSVSEILDWADHLDRALHDFRCLEDDA